MSRAEDVKDEDGLIDYVSMKGVVAMLLVNGGLSNKVLNDLRGYGDFDGDIVGKKLSICTCKDTSNIGANDDGDDLD